MPVTLHQPAVGLNAGDSYTGPLEAWLVEEGYADDGVAADNTDNTGLDAVDDPTLAVNREEPGEAFEVSGHLAAADVTGVDPNTGPAAGGNTVSITGDHFIDASAVSFGANPATTFEVVDDTEILATVPAGTAGAVDVVVTDADGSDTLVGGYTYQ